MTCPKCCGTTSVVDSRPARQTIRRRRKCDSCSHRFTTYETMEESPIEVALSKQCAELRAENEAFRRVIRAVSPSVNHQ